MPKACFTDAVRNLACCGSLLIALATHFASAATLLVTSTADDGSPGTLRAAIAAAADGDSIEFALPNPSLIALDGTAITIAKSLSVNGPGATALTVRQSANLFGGVETPFVVDDGLAVALSGLTLTHALAPAVQGIGLQGGAGASLALSDMVLRAFDTAAQVRGPATVQRSTFDANFFGITMARQGATLAVRESAVVNGTGYGLVLYQGDATLINSTIAATDTAVVLAPGPTLRVINSTIARNRIGFHISAVQPGATNFIFKNTLLAHNAGGNCTPNAAAVATSGGHNLDSDGSCSLSGAGEQSGAPAAPLDARLGPLAINGGPTLSIAPAIDSTAVNAIPAALCSDLGNVLLVSDQRGMPRPSGSACDIGSVELQYVLDIDRNLSGPAYGGLTDGLLILRHLRGLTGPALTAGVLAPSAARTAPYEVKQYLDAIAPQLDIDGNGVLNPAVDGVLILRYLLGLRGSALTAGISTVGTVPPPTRVTAQDIEAYLTSLTAGR